MKKLLALCVLLSLAFSVLAIWVAKPVVNKKIQQSQKVLVPNLNFNATIKTINDIPLPNGYKRIQYPANSMATWLRQLPLKPTTQLHLFNGQPSNHQNWVYAIANISVPTNGLQQCADAIMRLRAEYFFANNKLDSIRFPTSNTMLSFNNYKNGCLDTACLQNFLTNVFANCGTYTLQDITEPVPNILQMQSSNVFVRPGSPGHGIIIADIAVNNLSNEKIYLLLQSYMPSEEIHVLKNISKPNMGAWYKLDTTKMQIVTPGYVFLKSHLRQWK